MKLNYRDLVILGILLAIAILVAGFFLLIKPKNDEIKSNKDSLASLEEERSKVDSKVAEIEPLKTEIKDIYNDTMKLSDPFVDYNNIVNARKLDQYMQHFAEDCEVKIMTLNASELATNQLAYYYFTPSFLAEDQIAQADLNGNQQSAINAAKAESNALSARTTETVISGQYSISVKGKKEAIWNYMKALEEQEETIIINSVTLGNVEFKENSGYRTGNDDEEATAQFVITLYSVYDLAEPNVEE